MLRSNTDNFQVIDPLYQGGAAETVKILLPPSSVGVAKIYPSALPLCEMIFSTEKEALERLRHRHILSLLSSSNRGEYESNEASMPCRYLVLEYCAGGDLQSLLARQTLNTDLIRRIFKQLVSAVCFCHNSGLAHLNIRLEHILIDSKNNVKLASFGNCKALRGPDFVLKRSVKFHERYLAPECIRNQVSDKAPVDAFAAGVVLFVMYSGDFPFWKADRTDSLYRLFIMDTDKFWAIHQGNRLEGFYSRDFKQLVEGLLACDPVGRFSFQQVKENHWMNII